MNVLVHPDGRRNVDFRPLIDFERLDMSVYPYDPNRSFHYGLYSSAGQQACHSWQSLFNQFAAYQGDRPAFVVNGYGMDVPVRPDGWKWGLKYRTLAEVTDGRR